MGCVVFTYYLSLSTSTHKLHYLGGMDLSYHLEVCPCPNQFHHLQLLGCMDFSQYYSFGSCPYLQRFHFMVCLDHPILFSAHHHSSRSDILELMGWLVLIIYRNDACCHLQLFQHMGRMDDKHHDPGIDHFVREAVNVQWCCTVTRN